MSYTQRLVPVFVATFVGIATGAYVFQPLLDQYKVNTHGTFRPEDHDLKLQDGVAAAVEPKAQPEARSSDSNKVEDLKAALAEKLDKKTSSP
ncbi:hypothetical protein CF327_g1876 [Tilletia walkeri]|uniref:Uncharacterized protein n=1 Tax=Tilletia walkeri TaxID=117179 RepID=A0A8X7T632_9BASI|nr:hypothetical protein CF327_g1876 [Tilletia walkeri]KAE8269894.1 hypothetical protein A4X09_0g2454 [Tilletia walkeri]